MKKNIFLNVTKQNNIIDNDKINFYNYLVVNIILLGMCEIN